MALCVFFFLGYIFNNRFVIQRNLFVIASLYFCLLATSATPLMAYLGWQSLVTNSKESQTVRIYKLASDAIVRVGAPRQHSSDELNDLLKFCAESIHINDPQAPELKITATFENQDEARDMLVLPAGGYYGPAYDAGIRNLYFDLKRREDQNEDDYLNQIGIAGWSFKNRQNVVEDDVLAAKEKNKPYRYKEFVPSGKEGHDRSMMTQLISTPSDVGAYQSVGVLTISTSSVYRFKESDIRIAEFFARLLYVFSPAYQARLQDDGVVAAPETVQAAQPSPSPGQAAAPPPVRSVEAGFVRSSMLSTSTPRPTP